MTGKPRETLTNEYLTKNFSDNFTLALSSINAARAVVDSGKEFKLGQLLDSVARMKNKEAEDKISTACDISKEENDEFEGHE